MPAYTAPAGNAVNLVLQPYTVPAGNAVLLELANAILKDLTMIYNIMDSVEKDLSLVYNITDAVSKDLTLIYNLADAVYKDLTIMYMIVATANARTLFTSKQLSGMLFVSKDPAKSTWVSPSPSDPSQYKE